MKKVFNLSGKYNTMIAVIVGGILAVLIIAFLLIRPAWTNLQQLGEEIPKEQQSRDLARQDYDNLQSAEKFFKENSETVEQVNTAVPISPEVPSILVMLESLAEQNGVFLTSFSPQQVSAGNNTGSPASGSGTAATAAAGANPAGVDSIEVTANFRGPYPSLLNFLYNLERSLRITDVKTLTVTSTSNGLEGSISIKAYYVTVEGGPKPTTTTATGQAGSGATQASPAPASGGSK